MSSQEDRERLRESKACTVCGETKPLDEFHREARAKDGRTSSCRACREVQSKRWREANRERRREMVRQHRKRHPEKAKARWQLQSAVKEGRIEKPLTCERCAQTFEKKDEIQGHHRDYSKPLEVEWICRPCHVACHREEAANAH